jgi:RecB family endonuclease NucS
MRLVIADCTVDYAGRLSSHLPRATRLLMVKADGSVSIHADGRAYKPLNWMSPPCTLTELRASAATDAATDADAATATDVAADANALDEVAATWIVQNKAGETLTITVHVIHHDSAHALGDDPGLQKDGVEAHLQVLLAEQVQTFGDGWALVRREYPTSIGPVDLLCRDHNGMAVAVEIKRRGDIDGVEQLTRYLELLNRDPLLAPVAGVFAAQEIKPQARTLAEDRGIRCVVVDYEELRGLDDAESRLF